MKKKKSMFNRRTDEREMDFGDLGFHTVTIHYKVERLNPYNMNSYEILLEQIVVELGGDLVNVIDDIHDETKDEIIHGLRNHQADESDRLYEEERERRSEEGEH